VILAVEFVLGVLPALAFSIYLFPVGVFWVRSVLESASNGTANLYTVSIALIIVAGGLGLLSLCILMLGSWLGRGAPSRMLLAGLLLGVAASLGILITGSIMGGYWFDYYLFGAPLLVGAHQVYAGLRRGNRHARSPAPATP
jgi:hypothetical protein